MATPARYWTHESGFVPDDGTCGACADDDHGIDCKTPEPDRKTTDDMGDLSEGSAYCYCGHVIVNLR